ncbi:ABC transporter ATP-binding protein/permease [Candidatus Pelagibacter sp.]|nr:ABC transporter ATP-binding protein/permease [Candidatus Pelagibacter sp.]|tara:strand:+ start:306 stop:2096 length:1791 start_codon:yes stop_codon:yes gene_type:complete
MQTFKKLLNLLTVREHKSTAFLLGMILIMALIDMIGVASILPFMAVLTNPNIIETNNFLNSMFEASKIFGIENNQEFLFVLGLLVFLLLITSLSVRAITTYVQLRFIQMLEYSMTKRLIEGYLHQPYSWFLSRHSADIGKNILSEVAGVIGGGIKPIIEIIAKSMVAIALITLLFLANPKLTLIIGLLLGGTYMLIFYFIRSYLRKIGEKRLANNELRFKSVIEAFGAAKEVKVGGLEQTYVERFSEPSYIFAKTQASSGVIGQLPRYILEAIAFGGVLLIILYMMAQSGNFGTALPILSLYVFAGYRLMPALQQIYSSFTQLAFIGPSIEKLHEDIKSLKPYNRNQDQSALSFNKSITLKNVHYNYPNASRTALKDINLIIPIKSTVGLVGATGSGKTTTVDIILGLLEAKKGTLEIDGKIITQQNKRSWQKAIGYVPQHIYLTDDTISANIAFGVEIEDINQEAVEKASKIANLHEFIIDELPKKYQTTIGERGVRLSGGQRQRIGIARALYHNPQVLILDEATSALDNQTEKAVMDAVNNLNKDRTIILIAHRLGTVKNCDTIFLLDKGQLQHKGTFEELINVSENFRINAEN